MFSSWNSFSASLCSVSQAQICLFLKLICVWSQHLLHASSTCFVNALLSEPPRRLGSVLILSWDNKTHTRWPAPARQLSLHINKTFQAAKAVCRKTSKCRLNKNKFFFCNCVLLDLSSGVRSVSTQTLVSSRTDDAREACHLSNITVQLITNKDTPERLFQIHHVSI